MRCCKPSSDHSFADFKHTNNNFIQWIQAFPAGTPTLREQTVKLLCFVFCFVSSCCSAVVFVADASSTTGANQIGPIRIPKSKGTIEKRNASERPTSVDDLLQPFLRTSSQMQILNVQNFCASASHKCNFVLNQAKHKVSTTNCFGNAWAPRSCPNCSLFTSASSTHRP